MKGTVWRRGSTYTYQFAVPKDGGRRFISKGGFRTKGEAQAALTAAMAELGRLPSIEATDRRKLPLGRYMVDEWLPTMHGLKASTRKSYADLVAAYIAPHDIAHVRLANVTAGQIAKHYDMLRTSGRRRPKADGSRALTESTIHHVHVALSAAFGYAVEAGDLQLSPVAQLPRKARPKATGEQRPEMTVWTAVEARSFLTAAAGDRLVGLFDLALNTGMRRGELVGLRWVDVDLERATVAVRRNRVTVGYAVADGTPKSNRARTVELDDATVAMLRTHRRRQLEERLAWGAAWVDSGVVFTREDGEPLHPQTALWHLRKLSKAAGVPAVRLHDLRHTHATLGLAAGVPPKVMQERLGHSSVQITVDLYSHVVPGMQADAAAKIGALLRGGGL